MSNIIIIALLGYGLGNFSTSFFLGKLFKNTDIRDHGSGNAGATNALRVFGAKFAGLTFLLDGLKGVIAVLIGSQILGDAGALVGGLSAVIGHNWPIALKFKGGKGIATTIGSVLVINPLLALICIFIGIIVLIKTKYVSLASITGISLFPIIGLILVRPFDRNLFFFTLTLSLLAIYKHRANIKRLMSGSESKIGKKI